MHTDPIFWIFFLVFIFAMLAIDLGLFHRKAHKVSFKESLSWAAVWICLAFAFNFLIYQWKGTAKGIEFMAGYLIELSLSIDNLFVFFLIFKYFQIPSEYQHRVLFWGILGALVMRAMFIFMGIAIITKFHWTIYLFGAILVLSGLKMWFEEDKKIEPQKNIFVRAFRVFFPVTHKISGDKFFIKSGNKFFATPIFLVLIIIETTDVIFAVDSVPAILAITTDAFIVFTSNAFAILGLRSMYFALAGVIDLFKYLHYGLSAILIFIGIKMALSGFYTIPIEIALTIVLIILVISIAMSLLSKDNPAQDED